MYTLPNHFQELLSAIEPTGERAEKACAIPTQVRDYLESCLEIQTVSPYTRLAGSYARHTAVKHIQGSLQEKERLLAGREGASTDAAKRESRQKTIALVLEKRSIPCCPHALHHPPAL